MASFAEFRRYPRSGHVAGVCAGIGVYMGWNIKLIRIAVLAAFFLGGGFPVLCVYALLWYLMDVDEARLPPGADRHGRWQESPIPAPSGGGATASCSTIGGMRGRFERMESRLRSMEACVAENDYELRREFRKLET